MDEGFAGTVEKILIAVAALVTGVLGAWGLFRKSRNEDDIKKKNAELEIMKQQAKEAAEQKEQERIDRKNEADEKKKEQRRLDDQRTQLADYWHKKFEELSGKTDAMIQEHIKCRQENAVIAAKLDDAMKTIETLTAKIVVLESQVAQVGGP